MLENLALRKDAYGYSQMIFVASCKTDQMRPRRAWAPGAYYNLHWVGGSGQFDTIDQETLESVKELQQLLRRLGPTLVRMKLLEP